MLHKNVQKIFNTKLKTKSTKSEIFYNHPSIHTHVQTLIYNYIFKHFINFFLFLISDPQEVYPLELISSNIHMRIHAFSLKECLKLMIRNVKIKNMFFLF